MATYVICKNRQDRKIALEICQAQCKEQWDCEPFNRIMFDKPKGEQAEEPAETPAIEEPEESDDTDVQEEKIEGVPALRSKAQQLYEHVLALKAEIEVRWFELGKVLKEIKEGRHYIDLGYTNWKDFCELGLGVLQLRWRAMDYLIEATKICDDFGIKKETAGQIGWSKLKEIKQVITKENKDHWIDLARKKETTVHSLWGKVQVALGKKTPKEVEVLTKNRVFHLFPEQEPIVDLAFEVARRVSNSDKEGYLLADIICPSFLAEHPVEGEIRPKPEVIVKLLERFQAAFKIKFTGEVIDAETGEILVETKE